MKISITAALVTVMLAVAAPTTVTATATAQIPADADTLNLSGLIAAESTVDSLRAEMRKLDRDIQAMKQNLADSGNVDQLLEALAGAGEIEPDAPEDTRSRRQRLDTLLRAITQRPGQLRFNGGATVVAQSLTGDDVSEAAGTGTLDLYAHTSFGPSTLLFFAFEAGGGEGLDGIVPVGTSVNGDASATHSGEGFDHLVLNEAWAEFTALDDAVILTAGKIDLTNYFDINVVANDETAQFLTGAFTNSSALLVPGSGPGLRARTVVVHRFSVQAGLVSADSTGGTRFRDTFLIGSVGMRLYPDTDYDGNFRTYLYSPPHADGAKGWGLSVDQEMGSDLTAFGRYGSNDESLADQGPARQSWSTGLQWERPRPNRNFVLAAAYGEARGANDTLIKTFETYASWQLNTWTFLSPHVQVVRNEAVVPAAATIFGVRLQFNF